MSGLYLPYLTTNKGKLAIGQLIVNILNIILILAACGGKCNNDIQFFKCVSCFAFVLGVSLIGINLGKLLKKYYRQYINLIINVILVFFYFIAPNLLWDDITDDKNGSANEKINFAVIGACLCGLIATFLYIFDLYLVIKDFKNPSDDDGDKDCDDSDDFAENNPDLPEIDF